MHNSLTSDISKLASGLDLVVEDNIEDLLSRKKHSLFTSIAFGKNGEQFIFRVALNEVMNQRVLRETEIYKEAKTKKLSFFPEIINYGYFLGHQWLIYKYIEGNLAGNVYQFDEGFNFEPLISFLEKKKELSDNFVTDLFPKFTVTDFKKELRHSLSVCPATVKAFAYSLVELIYDNLGEIKTQVLTHCDLHPKNIIVNDGKGILVIDWESSCLSSVAYDYSFIWSRCGNTVIRTRLWEDLLAKYPNIKNEASVMFLITLVRDYIGWAEIKEGKNPYLAEKDIINGVSVDHMLVDLRNQIKVFEEKLRERR